MREVREGEWRCKIMGMGMERRRQKTRGEATGEIKQMRH